jgi:hypothetical protein
MVKLVRLATAISVMAALFVFACNLPADDSSNNQAGKDGQKIEEAKKPSGGRTDTSFLRKLLKKDQAGFGDGIRAAWILLKGADEEMDFSKRREELIRLGIVPADWTYTEDTPLTKGMVSYLIVKVLDIKGGVTMRIFGCSERYALRECAYLGLIVDGPKSKYVTGGELLGVMARSEKYQKESESEESGVSQE